MKSNRENVPKREQKLPYCELVKYDRRVGQSQTGWRLCSLAAAGEQACGEVDAEEDPGKAMMLVGRERKPGNPTESREEHG